MKTSKRVKIENKKLLLFQLKPENMLFGKTMIQLQMEKKRVPEISHLLYLDAIRLLNEGLRFG